MISPIYRLGRKQPLVILSDIHIGAEHFCARRFEETLRWCTDAGACLLLNGDLIENALWSGKAGGEMLLDQAVMPTDQVKLARDYFKPFARRGRIVGITRGNHDSRTRRTSLLDLCDVLAHGLDVPYFGLGGLVRFVTKGADTYTIALHHGRSGAANIWLELDRMLALYPAAELVALGHNHALDSRQVGHLQVGPDGAERTAIRWQVRTGSYLGFADYVREMLLRPSPVGSPIIRFSEAAHQIDVDTRTLSWLDD